MTSTFQAGKTYWTRSVGDYDCIIEAQIASRTAKTITTSEGKRFGVKVWNGVEQFAPWGRYSMSPIIKADKARGQ